MFFCFKANDGSFFLKNKAELLTQIWQEMMIKSKTLYSEYTIAAAINCFTILVLNNTNNSKWFSLWLIAEELVLFLEDSLLKFIRLNTIFKLAVSHIVNQTSVWVWKKIQESLTYN